jgi:hypothetical protein
LISTMIRYGGSDPAIKTAKMRRTLPCRSGQ